MAHKTLRWRNSGKPRQTLEWTQKGVKEKKRRKEMKKDHICIYNC
jgi:hypothetical protein